ncbi:MAG: hypothetical protein SPF89_12215 [Sphaerochaetaceae bacterium]|nr:hypothetical protein [Spirochaetales bacterium]MDY5500858.1 hypothetical protein [Sphaerochaetaceae bacterium]
MGRRVSLFHICMFIMLFISFVVASYLLYVTLQYHHIPDNQQLDIEGVPSEQMLKNDTVYRIATWNIGWGAYTPAFSAYQETGTMLDGSPTRGLHATAPDQDTVVANLRSIIAQAKQLQASMILLQEVDEPSGRSRRVDERAMIESNMEGFESVWAENLHTAFLLWPPQDIQGSATSGLLTLSRHPIEEAVRRSYQADDAFPEIYFNLDPCFSVSSLPVENGKTLYLINSQMVGTVKPVQLQRLANVMLQIQEEGNYAVCGGDFSMALVQSQFPTTQQRPVWAREIDRNAIPDGLTLYADEKTPTVRAADIPYRKGITYTTVVDGFLVTKGIRAQVFTVDTDFSLSDHQPVLLDFVLE